MAKHTHNGSGPAENGAFTHIGYDYQPGDHWVSNQTRITAARMNKIEGGLKDTADQVDLLSSEIFETESSSGLKHTLYTHINDLYNNPHAVTAEQVGAYDKDTIDGIVNEINTFHEGITNNSSLVTATYSAGAIPPDTHTTLDYADPSAKYVKMHITNADDDKILASFDPGVTDETYTVGQSAFYAPMDYFTSRYHTSPVFYQLIQSEDNWCWSDSVDSLNYSFTTVYQGRTRGTVNISGMNSVTACLIFGPPEGNRISDSNKYYLFSVQGPAYGDPDTEISFAIIKDKLVMKFDSCLYSADTPQSQIVVDIPEGYCLIEVGQCDGVDEDVLTIADCSVLPVCPYLYHLISDDYYSYSTLVNNIIAADSSSVDANAGNGIITSGTYYLDLSKLDYRPEGSHIFAVYNQSDKAVQCSYRYLISSPIHEALAHFHEHNLSTLTPSEIVSVAEDSAENKFGQMFTYGTNDPTSDTPGKLYFKVLL